MSIKWNKDIIKKAMIGARTATYKPAAQSAYQKLMEETHPEMFQFKALSVGCDEIGQLFIVPLDESSKENAEYILRAIRAYEGE